MVRRRESNEDIVVRREELEGVLPVVLVVVRLGEVAGAVGKLRSGDGLASEWAGRRFEGVETERRERKNILEGLLDSCEGVYGLGDRIAVVCAAWRQQWKTTEARNERSQKSCPLLGWWLLRQSQYRSPVECRSGTSLQTLRRRPSTHQNLHQCQVSEERSESRFDSPH